MPVSDHLPELRQSGRGAIAHHNVFQLRHASCKLEDFTEGRIARRAFREMVAAVDVQ